MSLYVKLETRILTDSKIIAAGPDGFALWAKGLCYSKEHLTDGFIPSHALAVLGIGMRNVNATVRKLCVVGLWSVCENGFTVGAENWADHQTTKAEVNINREKARLRKAASRARHAVTQDDVTDESQGCHAIVTQPEPEHRAQSQSTEPYSFTPSAEEKPDSPKGSGSTSKRFVIPTEAEVESYMRSRGWFKPKEGSIRFIAHYTAKGWKIGTTPVKDWKACVITFEQTAITKGHPVRPDNSTKEQDDERTRRARELADR